MAHVGEILDARENDAFSGAATFSFRHRLVRLLWMVTWVAFARWTPPFMRRWRLILLRMFGATVDKTSNVYASVKVWYPANLTLGAQSVLGPGVICYSMGKVTIGKRVVVSQRAHLCGGTHRLDTLDFQLYTKDIHVEDYAWIAAEAFVAPGVRIKEGAVLGARGVAFQDLEPWSIYVGNPALFKRNRARFIAGQDGV